MTARRPAPLLALLCALAAAWPVAAFPVTLAARVDAATLESDHERAAIVLRLSREPRVSITSDERARTVVVDFQPAQLPEGGKLFPARDVLEAASLEQVAPDVLRLVLKVRRDASITVLRSTPEAPGYTCAVVVADELGDVGPAGHALTWPVRGRVSSRFGMRVHPILHTERMHKGVDIAVPHGTPVRAMRAGVVTFAGWKGASGLAVTVSHGNGLVTEYKHCSKLRVAAGDRVKRHQILGEAGSTGMSTGSHLHFTITEHGREIDPARLMRKRR